MPLVTYQIATLKPTAEAPRPRPRRRQTTAQRGEMICGLHAVGEILGLSQDRIKRLMDEGRLEYIQIGRRYYFRRECLDAVGRSKAVGEAKRGKTR